MASRRTWGQSFAPGLGVETSTPQSPLVRRASVSLPVPKPESRVSDNHPLLLLPISQHGVVLLPPVQEVTLLAPVSKPGNWLSGLWPDYDLPQSRWPPPESTDCVPGLCNCFSELRERGLGDPNGTRSGIDFSGGLPISGWHWAHLGYI